ncbi:PF03235 family protein [Fusobacterium sp. CM21]|uniref:DUF4357 domain-containing protein n=1 Tax=Fusobacterium vincentii TaxID=155615 RepID=A0AAJ1FM68_FUSVC|nr:MULTISPECIES: DUF4357 domain-containing protein [Fusobacterium]ETT04714.1 PF03235 family protein [Fusobacterium sp. CM21]ERT45795.1 hypothetical protein HMPREF1768_01103 [Fusobacterium nucleatum CTI-7]MCW0263195.1 DUF4357 domain-containing protein [Fusobacterium vincentii]MDH2314754.1 DUF4357 domain-containing protein [Fusobacterium nucleatum]OHU81129.1 hypothetical protein BKN39_09445 [Fusobacterium nucleatum]
MKASEKKIKDLFSEAKTFFAIPVYQRDYNWQEKHCKQLFEDILNVGKDIDITSHFIGSIVYIHEGVYGIGEKEFYVIDGQQRMITITLLHIVLYHRLKESKEEYADELYELYLVNKFSKRDIKLKLLPPEENLNILNKILEENWEELEEYQDRNIVKNYKFFKEIISNYSNEEIEYLLAGLDKVIYVDIALEKDKDDPQRIFESLNSTGLDLSQGDLIRNYILMDLEREKQNLVYKNLWLPIENNCKISLGNEIKNYVSDFIRDYLTLKNGKIPSKPKVFEEFKEFYNKNNDEQLEDIKNFSEEYSHIIKPNTEKDKEIRKELENLKVLDQTVINTFLIGILRDYRENKIIKNEILEILKLLQSYIWRRFITEKPSNALNKIFQGMYFRISKDQKYYKSLEESLLNQDFPTDDELKEALKTKNVYKDKEKLRYVFKELENYNHNELIDFENEKITIEHIFPQKPNKSWKEKYSDYELEEMKTFKDTISNLTLTGSNANLGNKSFLEKRNDDIHGYKNSKLYLNKYLGKLNEWNLSAMEGRFEKLFKNIVKIWKRPESSEDKDIEKVTFVLKGAASSGTGKLLAYEKFEILKGSIIVKGNKGNENVEKRNKRIIEELIENNLVEKDGNKYILKENYKVSSPSAAASLILGRNANGWKEWKTFDGKLLNEFRK